MRDIGDFLARLSKMDVKLSLDGGELKCSAPKDVLTSELVAQLRERKAAIIAYLEEISAIIKKKQNPILPAPRVGPIPASQAQYRLWFIEQMGIQDSTYMIRNALRLRGRMDVRVFEKAINTIISRHEVLRTNFIEIDGAPIQHIHVQRKIDVTLVGLQGLSDPSGKAVALMLGEMNRPFDLAVDTLLRVSLYRLNANEHMFQVVMHHIISDGWSMNVMIHELTELYNAFLDNKPDPLSALSIQYADYAHWQTQWLNGKMLNRQKAYWSHQLAEVPDYLALPTKRPHLPMQSFCGERIYFHLHEALSDSIKKMASETGCTLFIFLEAAFAAFLYRITGQNDFLIGTPVANRNSGPLEPMIGLFVNTVALRHKVDGAAGFPEFLKEARTTSVDAFSNQDIPFEQVVDVLKPKRSLSYNTLFQVVFVLQKTDHQEQWLRGLRSSAEELKSDSAKFDLTMAMSDAGSHLSWSLEYNTDLFDEGCIRSLAMNLECFLEGVIRTPDATLDSIPLLRLEERAKLPRCFTTEKKNETVFELFERMAQRWPDTVALQYGIDRTEITYRDLKIRSNQFAVVIRQFNTTTIAIDLQNPIDGTALMLGALKTGIPFMVLPNTMAWDQKAALVDMLKVDTLICRGKQAVKSFNIIDMNELVFSENSAVRMADVVNSTHASIMLGSSFEGLPKASIITNEALLSAASTFAGMCRLKRQEVVLQMQSLFSETGQQALFAGLISGATGSFPGETVTNITSMHIINCMPWAFKALKKSGLLDQVGNLRLVIASGEHASYWQDDVWLTDHSSVTLMHCLSLPETAGVITSQVIADGREYPFTTPVGKPIGQNEVAVVDSLMSPVPTGVIGQLVFTGPALAREYLQNPSLTKARFVTLPDAPGKRWFLTGISAFRRPNGSVVLVGSSDAMSKDGKIRCLTDTEAVIWRHPEVSETVAAVIEDHEGNKILVAYYSDGTVTLQDLEKDLPSYLCPAAIIKMEALPRNFKGRIDYHALPTPSFTSDEKVFTKPHTPAEEILTLIWSEVLQRKNIDVFDNFFDLGGQSLMATRVASRIRETMGVELPLKSLFLNPTIAGLAGFIDGMRQSGKTTKLPSIERRVQEEPAPLSFAQKRLWFIHELNPINTAYNLPICC